MSCVEKILNSAGQGDCKACICEVIPQLCQKNETVPTEGQRISGMKKVEVRSKVELDDGAEASCNFLTCTGPILGEFEISKGLSKKNSFLKSSLS